MKTSAGKRTLLILAFLVCFDVVSVAAIAVPQNSGQTKPNIVFIVADDLGMQDVGFMGSQYFETPHLDALAEQSLVLNQAYMYPTCSPSRAAILTGKHSFRTGCYNVPVLEKGKPTDNIFSRWTIGIEHPIYSQPLNQAGYKLIHLGKWHIVGPNPKSEVTPLQKKLPQPKSGDLSWLAAHQSAEIQQYYPTGRGFHENVGGTWWGDPARGYSAGYKSPSGGYLAPFNNPFIADREDDHWLTDRLTSDAIDFMKRNKDEPFFVNLNYYAPHRPSIARNEESLNYFLNKDGDPDTGQGLQRGKNKREIAAYATMVKSIDDNVQRIVEFLNQSGLRKNTILIFTSDNGFNGLQSCNNNLRGAKGNIYEGGIRVPALINWSETIAPARSDRPISGLDFFPTFLDFARVDNFDGKLDGDSLRPVIEGRSLPERALFWHVASTYKDQPCSVVRKGDWKLIQFLKRGEVELYNLKTDLKESKNQVQLYPTKAKELLDELTNWRKANQVPLPPSSELTF